MASKKIPLKQINDLDEADQILARMGEAQREIALIETALNEAIDQLKTEAQLKSQEFREVLGLEEERLKYFSQDNRKLFEDRQSRELAHGVIGFRKSTSLSLAAKGDTWEEVAARLEEGKHKEAVRIKKEVDKDILKKWPEDRIRSFGLKLKESEKFFVEVVQEKVVS
jgi:phage host-nuclease inhibitor protein Gam